MVFVMKTKAARVTVAILAMAALLGGCVMETGDTTEPDPRDYSAAHPAGHCADCVPVRHNPTGDGERDGGMVEQDAGDAGLLGLE